ncbi:MAG: BtpA/SgcQ family protein [Treponema sp.]|jgi:membrane complex biogenesis BtpA family protein|nr:BtpA/SgcQ family protein [Treponema sp.]
MTGREWIKKTFGTVKPVIAMCHLDALPGDPKYDMKKGLPWIIGRARENLTSLQDGGIDAVMFSNEFSLPYLTKVEPITQTVMARIIGELLPEIRVPYGVNVLWDAGASVELAVAVGASFVREIFTGVYAGDFGLWNTNCGAVARLRSRLGAEDVKLMFNILPEASVYLGSRSLADIAKTTVFNGEPEMVCVSGMKAGTAASIDALREVTKAIPGTPVFANTGVSINNVVEQLSVADGAVIGSAFKKNNDFFDLVDQRKVARLMDAVRAFRK